VRPADMARALGVSQATVSDWESGAVTPRDEHMVRLADYLGVSPAFLRYGVRPEQMVEPNPALDRKVTEAELRSAQAIVDQQPARKADRPRRRRSGGEGA
jgi:transcriptional regulator with XRE-family HTH domain